MFKSVRSGRALTTQAEIQITPLIDMVFILLIFFIVTTSFVSQTGLGLERPVSSSSQELPPDTCPVEIDAAGRIALEGRRIGLFSLRPLLERRLRTRPASAVVIVADRTVPAQRIVQIMDEVRAAGINRVALAAQKRD